MPQTVDRPQRTTRFIESMRPSPLGSAPVSPDAYRRASALTIATAIIVLVGIAARLYVYVTQPSLWLDEVAITRNLTDRSLWQLLTVPLDFAQVAPKGFLLYEWAVAHTLGTSERALRLPVVIASIASLVICWPLAMRLASGIAVPIAMAIIAVGIPFLDQAAQVKPYSSDFALSALFLILLLDLRERPLTMRRAVAIGVGGAIALWFSQHLIVTLFAFGVATAIIALLERDRVALAPLATMLGLWCVSAALASYASLHEMSPGSDQYMRYFWRGGFMPLHPTTSAELPWNWSGHVLQGIWVRLTGRLWDFGTKVVLGYALLTIAGLVLLWVRRRAAAIYVTTLGAVLLAMSALGQFPIMPLPGSRLILFENALLVLLAAEAISWMFERLTTLAPDTWPLAIPVSVAAVAPIAYATAVMPPPYQHESAREMVSHVRAHWQPGDELWASDGVALSVMHFGLRAGFSPSTIHVGECSSDPRTALRELDRFRGGRLWVLVFNGMHKDRLVDGYLRAVGTRLDSLRLSLPGTRLAVLTWGKDAAGAPMGELFDLRNANRAVTPDNYRIPANIKLLTDPRDCFGAHQTLHRESGIPGPKDWP